LRQQIIVLRRTAPKRLMVALQRRIPVARAD
jgi:hypothetical protein